MPKNKIADYTFYKIINVNCDVDLCYVGSTVNMIERVRSHKYNCKNHSSAKYHLKVYKTIREHGGWDEFKIIEIGYEKQLTLTEAHVIEEKYRVELCAELNSQRCHVTYEARKESDALFHRNLYQNNKEVFSKRQKVYNQVNKEVVAERRKVYYENNKELLSERRKVYCENNKDKIKARKSEKITCECGCVIGRGSLASHCKSKKHIDLMNNKNNIELIHNG